MTSRFDVLEELAGALGGEVSGGRVLAPGPNHSAADRSLSVWPTKNSAGFSVHSFSGDDRLACIQHVKALLDPEKRAALAKLGAEPAARKSAEADRPQKVEQAREIWKASVSPVQTLAEVYLWRARRLDLPPEVAGEVIRYHPAAPWKDLVTKKTFHAPCMIAAMRSIATDEIVGVQRTRLTIDGKKIDRRYTGVVGAAAIKLDADVGVEQGLHVGEGLETTLAARAMGLKPAWALGSAGAIKNFPLLAGVECLSILVELDAGASDKASAECAERWHAAGREVITLAPKTGKDFNDLL
jgi:hypothetical protein